MAYETGVSTSPSDLLSKIYNHAGANGWTQVRSNGAVTGASSNQHSISDGSAAEANQWNMVAFNATNTAEIRLQPSTGDGGAGVQFFNHTGTPNSTGNAGTFPRMGHGIATANLGFVGPHVAYYIFSGALTHGRYIHVVCEAVSGCFFHLWFGTIKKAGTFNGGQYATASCTHNVSAAVNWPFMGNFTSTVGSAWLRGDALNGFGTPGWQTLHGDAHDPNGSNPCQLVPMTYKSGVNQFNGRTPFGPVIAPFWATVAPTKTSTLYYLLGHLPDVRVVSMDGREPGEQIVLGSDTWHLFPAYRKTTDGVSVTSDAYQNTFTGGLNSTLSNDSNLAGYAFREVP